MNCIILFDPDLCNFYSLAVNWENKRGWISAPSRHTFINGMHGYPIVERSDLAVIFKHRLYEIKGFLNDTQDEQEGWSNV